MAVTQGHGNPAWTEDEIILALDLYFELGGKIPGATDDRVVALSRLLRSFPYHAEAARKPSFRNAAGVAFKLQNLRSVGTGKGLKNTSREDRAVWSRWGSDAAGVRLRARLIRDALVVAPAAEFDSVDEELFEEGRMATYLHQRRERNPKIRAKFLKKRRDEHALKCDICGYRNKTGNPDFDDAALEAHHVRPLSEVGESPTRLTDLALLCATCHRLIHRAIARERRWLGVDELRELLSRPF